MSCWSQTHHTIVTQLLQSSVRLLDCPWLQQQHRGQVETCIKTLAMTGNTHTHTVMTPPTSSHQQTDVSVLSFLFSEESLHLPPSGPGGSDQLHVVHVCSQLFVPLQPKLQVVLPVLQTQRSQQPLGLQEHHREAAGTHGFKRDKCENDSET